MIEFHYTRVSAAFLDQVATLVENRESVVLLGARQIGKRYVLSRLAERLQQRRMPPPLLVQCLNSDLTDNQPIGLLPETFGHSCVNPLPCDTKRILATIDEQLSGSTKSATLLLSDVGALPYPDARELLTGLRTRVEGKTAISGSLSVVLTGEADLRELVYGPNSEFNCAQQFVLQGLAEDQFREFIGAYAKCLHLEFDDSDDTVPYLYERTGGHGYLFRLILWATFERQALRRQLIRPRLRKADLCDSVSPQHIPWVYGSGPIRHAVQLIACDPDAWPRLHGLLRCGSIPVKDGAPDLLELVGVAVRSSDHLQLASPIVADLLKEHYTDRRFADLFARVGDWGQAFANYQSLPKEQRRATGRGNEVADMETTVKGLAVKLHSEAVNGSIAVQQLFVKGCRLLLGFRHVTFWKYPSRFKYWPETNFPKWCYDHEKNGEASAEPDGLKCVLPTVGIATGRVSVTPPQDRQVVVGILADVRPNTFSAVIVGDFQEQTPFSPECKRLAEFLLDEFICACERALSIERGRARLEIREKYSRIYDGIVGSLGRDVTNVTDALKIAARDLRKIGYRRVLFCLVDSTEKHIRGVLDDSDNPRIDLARTTDYPLFDPKQDVQPYVISTRTYKIIPDASQEPLTNKVVVRDASLRAMAVVPLLTQQGTAIGTVHIERQDGEVPTSEEVEDLEAFGRRLAIAVEQCEQVTLLQGALDKQPEPVFILDPCQRLRYANQRAATLLNVLAGWQNRNAEPFKLDDHSFIQPLNGDDRVNRSLTSSLERGRRGVTHLETKDEAGHDFTGAVLTDAISIRLNEREQVIGALCHTQDLTYLYHVFDALRLLQETSTTDSVIQNVLQAMQTLGQQWGRLYLVSPNDTDAFVSRDCFGITNPAVEQKIRAGEFRLKRSSEPGHESWVCITQQMPMVFCCNPNIPDHRIVPTPLGLEVTNVANPDCPPELSKQTGDHWIDFPLLAGDKVLGKVTLACDVQHFGPEDYEFLKLFAVMTTNLLKAIQQRERGERAEWIEAAAERAVFDTCHHLATILAAFPILLERYRLRVDQCPKIALLNTDFEHLIRQITEMISSAKSRLAPVNVQRKRCNVVRVVQTVLQSALSNGMWTIDNADNELEADVDKSLLGSIFHELIQNSRACAENPARLFVSVDIHTESRPSADWLVFNFRDNGPGIPDSLKERIFENFFSQRSGMKTGTGLGLGFVRRVIAGHGGRIDEQGTRGDGAWFHIEMPRWFNETQNETQPFNLGAKT